MRPLCRFQHWYVSDRHTFNKKCGDLRIVSADQNLQAHDSQSRAGARAKVWCQTRTRTMCAPKSGRGRCCQKSTYPTSGSVYKKGTRPTPCPEYGGLEVLDILDVSRCSVASESAFSLGRLVHLQPAGLGPRMVTILCLIRFRRMEPSRTVRVISKYARTLE
jgi:hypothetical protein